MWQATATLNHTSSYKCSHFSNPLHIIINNLNYQSILSLDDLTVLTSLRYYINVIRKLILNMLQFRLGRTLLFFTHHNLYYRTTLLVSRNPVQDVIQHNTSATQALLSISPRSEIVLHRKKMSPRAITLDIKTMVTEQLLTLYVPRISLFRNLSDITYHMFYSYFPYHIIFI